MAAFISVSPLSATNLPPATVSFLDGSFLRGEIGALAGDTLRWLHPNARAPIEFSTTNLNLIRLPQRTPVLPTNAGPVCRVVLASGDEFEGSLLSLDADSFEVDTWFAGRLRGQRTGLQSLAFYGSSQSALYDGPRAADEWKISTGAATANRVGVDILGGLGNVVVRPAVPVAPAVPQFRLVEPARKEPTPQELVAQIKAELASLGEKVSPVVRQALEKRLKEAEETAAKAGAQPVEPKAPVVVPPIPAPAIPPRLAPPSAGPNVARRTFSEAELARLSEDAERAATVAVFLKTDLVQAALQAGQTSQAALERWFADFKDPNDWAKDEAKTARFKVMLRAEVDVLVRRLQGRAAPFAEAAVPAGPAPLPLPAVVAPPPVVVRAGNKPTAADISTMASRARISQTLADYLKSELVQLAVEAGLVKAEALKADLDKQAEASDARTVIRREGALLTARLLRELEHLKNDPSATALVRTYEILGGMRPGAAVAAQPAVQPHAVAAIMRLVEAAQKAAVAGEFIKSDLVRAAVDAGVASERVLERWFEEYADAAVLARDKAKETRFKALLKSEAALLGIRLLRTLGPGAGVAESATLELQQAQAQADLGAGALAAAQADVLAQARARALGALQLNNFNFAVPAGAEAVLAGRVAAAAPGGANAAWTFRDGAYYSTGVGTLGRECHLPTKARVEFDLAWKGQPYFRFSFFTRSTEHYDYSDGWQFYTSSSGYIYSMRRSGMGATSSSGARVPQMLAKNSVRFTFLVNTEKETVTLMADGERVHEWKNLGSPGPGTGIVFYNYNTSSRVRISDIRVSPWDGRERDAAPPGAPGDDPEKLVEVPPADSAVVEFVNNDRATGTLHGIRDGKLAFNPAGTRLDIPLARAALISFPVADAPALPKVEGVQVTLHRNERLTLALEKWEAEEIIAVSPVFGRLKLKPESVRALRFNPSALRGATDEWSGP